MAEPTPAPTLATPDVRLLRSITLRNILSFGPDTPPLELRALNVLIGPNGSGKSNLLACLSLLPAIPTSNFGAAFRQNGNTVKNWFRNSQFFPTATLATIVVAPGSARLVRHELRFKAGKNGVEIQREEVRNGTVDTEIMAEKAIPYQADFEVKPADVKLNGQHRRGFSAVQYNSILEQIRDPRAYPSFSQLTAAYQDIFYFQDWTFGINSPIRQPKPVDGNDHFLRADGANLVLVLHELNGLPEIKQRFTEALHELYEGVKDYETVEQAGYIGLYMREGNTSIPATRLSDGTLRYLCLLAILLHPTPPPLICLEEPELGLHPDAIVAVGKLIKEASTRTQLIITTHSQILVDTFQESPEDIVVVSKKEGSTHFNRLDPDKLRPYLETYSLGNLWSSGDIGGNRW